MSSHYGGMRPPAGRQRVYMDLPDNIYNVLADVAKASDWDVDTAAAIFLFWGVAVGGLALRERGIDLDLGSVTAA